nr:nitrite reductase small subunit NirD [Caldalkalibacillus salinus]
MIEIGPVDELPQNTGKTVRVQGYEVALFKLSNGDVRAIENRCPHKGGVLAEGIVSGEYVFCPMHDQKISLSSGHVQPPDTGCVTTYPVVITDHKIYIDSRPLSKEVCE